MVQRAAGCPGAVSAPHPPSQFHWPASGDSAATRPVLLGANSDPGSRSGRRAIGATRALGFAAESSPPKHGLAALTRPYRPPVDSPGTIDAEASTSVLPADESIENRAVIDHGRETTLTDPQAPAGIELLTPTRPAESTSSALFHREESAKAGQQPFANDSGDVLASRTARILSKTADLAAPEQPVRPVVIEHAAHTIKETREEALPVPIRPDIPARSTPAAQPAPPRSVRAQSRVLETQPPVEVKIGSVEIVFDQPPVQAVQLAPVRPAGFAEFAGLRCYAARPWSARGR